MLNSISVDGRWLKLKAIDDLNIKSKSSFENSKPSCPFSLLAPGHPSDLNLSNGIEPPSGFRQTSPCPGLDRPASGLIPVTVGAFTPACLKLAQVSLSLRVPCVSLATEINSLPRVSKRATPLLQARAMPTYSYMVSGSFHLRIRILFTFPSPY